MKTLAILRHGSYSESSGLLNSSGQEQMRTIAQKLKPVINGGTVRIITSTAPRAIHSSEILGGELGVKAEPHEVLWSDNGHDPDFDRALALIREQDAHETVVVVTHLEYSEELAFLFGEKVLGVRNFPRHNTEKGEAWVIDVESKACSHMSGHS